MAAPSRLPPALLTAAAAAACFWPAAAVRLSAPALPQGDPCACLFWANTYESGLVKCGDGMEVATSMSAGLSRSQAIQVDHGCHLYPKLKANFCVKAKQGAHLYKKDEFKYDYTWCYVDKACKNLGEGHKINDHVSWKSCVEGVDRRYSDLHPTQLIAHAEAAGLGKDPRLLAAMSYPYIRATWKQVESFFLGKHSGQLLLERQVRDGLSEIVQSGKPMMICMNLHMPGNGRPDACGEPWTMVVVVGQELWFFPYAKPPFCWRNCPGQPATYAT